jgi:hypothetical protein
MSCNNLPKNPGNSLGMIEWVAFSAAVTGVMITVLNFNYTQQKLAADQGRCHLSELSVGDGQTFHSLR